MKSDNYYIIFKRIKYIREENELTQIQLAKILNTSNSMISKWENNTKFITLEKLNEFCNYFNTSMDYVAGLTNENKPIKKNYIDKQIVATKIKQIRKDNNITQKQLANILNTSQSTISGYENANTLILTSFLYQIAKKLNTKMDYICDKII